MSSRSRPFYHYLKPLARVTPSWLRYPLRNVILRAYCRAREHADPDKETAEYYVRYFQTLLDKPGAHPNIGNIPSEPERTRAFAGESLRILKEMGLRPGHRFIDYGCGSLHVGDLIIDYLEPGGYIGLDVTDVFFRDALKRFDPQWLQRKRPRLEVIGNNVMEDLGREPPDFIYSAHVAILVPPWELQNFISSLVSLVGPSTKCLLEFQLCDWPWGMQVSEIFTYHSRRQLRKILDKMGFGMREISSFPAISDGQRDSIFFELLRVE